MIKMNRREFLKYSSLSTAATLFPNVALSAYSDPTTWHKDVLSSLSKLENRPSHLNFLIPNGSQANLKPLSRLLAETVGIELRFTVAPVDDINTQLALYSGKGGQSYDLALPATFGLPDLASNGSIQPLDKFSAKYEHSGFQRDALYTLGDRVDDKLYGYQTDGDAYLMFFNKPWLEDDNNRKHYEDTFGKTLKVPETWEELDNQMKFFHNPEKNRFGGALFRTPDYLVWEWWVRFHSKGYFPLNDSLEPQIDNDAGVAALEELISASRYLSPGTRTNGLFENWQEYGEGNCYCNIGWGGTQKYLNSSKSKMREKLLFSPMPGGIIKGQTVRIPYFNWGWNYTIPTNTEHAEVAYLCALLAITPHVSTLAVRENGYFDPFREAHYNDEVIQSMYSQTFLSAHHQSMEESIPDFYLTGQSKYMSALKSYIHKAEKGDLSPEKALKAAANSWRGLHYRYGYETQLKQWGKIKQNYPSKLQILLT